jgi:hypothetical protein
LLAPHFPRLLMAHVRLSVELEYTFLFPSRNGRSLWAVIITLGTRDSCRKGRIPVSTAEEYRRVACT